MPSGFPVILKFESRKTILYMFFLNWKINYYLFQFLENMLLPLQVASLAETRSSSIIAES